MKIRGLITLSFVISGILLAQQPVPMGKSDDAPRTSRSADGTMLTKKSSDEDLERALYQDYENDPMFTGLQVKVKHHTVKLAGTVETKNAKRRAEDIAIHTTGVRYVHNILKVNEGTRPERTVESSTAH